MNFIGLLKVTFFTDKKIWNDKNKHEIFLIIINK